MSWVSVREPKHLASHLVDSKKSVPTAVYIYVEIHCMAEQFMQVSFIYNLNFY